MIMHGGPRLLPPHGCLLCIQQQMGKRLDAYRRLGWTISGHPSLIPACNWPALSHMAVTARKTGKCSLAVFSGLRGSKLSSQLAQSLPQGTEFLRIRNEKSEFERSKSWVKLQWKRGLPKGNANLQHCHVAHIQRCLIVLRPQPAS